MAINVTFGVNHSDDRFLTKDVTYSANAVSCDVYERVDRINPILKVDKTQIDLSQTNYMSIPEFGRKYFITDITGDTGKTVYVHGHVDVLGTYDTQIRACKCIAARSTTQVNAFLQDNARLFNVYTWNQYRTLGDIGAPTALIVRTLSTDQE